uniref:mucin-6-like n=1 Tax=Semicossyphus pulcher TaxID=241346 RepID=UPI0037E9BC73
MTSLQWLLTICFSLVADTGSVFLPVLVKGESATPETEKHTCRTFGSGVVQPFIGSSFYVRSNCPFTLTRFTHNRVECDITIRRDDSGLLVQVEIFINKIRTVLQNGSILVEKKSVSLPYDHTYQHIFHYGIYTKLKSSLLPLSVTWHNVPGGMDTLWVELDQELSTDMTGLCRNQGMIVYRQQMPTDILLAENECQIRDRVSGVNSVCRHFFSLALSCLQAKTPLYMQLCEENIYGYEANKYISCAFFKEVVQQCGKDSFARNAWRTVTECAKPSCPGDLVYEEQDSVYIPSCSNLNPRLSNHDLTSSCVCPKGKVLNDRTEGFQCVSVSSCPCEFAGKSFSSGDIRNTKCQSCMCDGGKWQCSDNFCPSRCLIEGYFVTTFDGKQYVVPGKCSYVASQGLNWKIIIEFSAKEPSLKIVNLQIFQDTYTFSHNMVTVGGEEITELYQSDHALVFWQSSMYVRVHTSLGIDIQVQVSPEIQLYITSPRNHSGMISGLCGNNNNDTTDDFTTSSGIVENSAQPFALSWSVGACSVDIANRFTKTSNEQYADEKCSVLNNSSGIFAECHGHIPTDHYYLDCIQRIINCGSSLQQCLCVALGSYVKACTGLGVVFGDWRKATNCTVKCQKNQEFYYNIQVCNQTCRSLSGPDPRCGLDYVPVEGCGCPEGTHLNHEHICTPKSECDCHYHGGTTPPGSVVIDGQKCSCDDGELHCSKDCGCNNGKVCVHCSESPVNTAQKTCDSLSKPLGTSMTCESGCYCPHDQYEDHHGNCVSMERCTCVYSGKVFSAGQSVKTSCKTCICGQGQWHCKEEPCPGRCQVYGNGHYQTFDSKWYRFDGHCQYSLVEDDCGNRNSTFSVRVESVPCCEEALTCSRSIVFELQGKVTLTLSDMRVTRRYHEGWTQEGSLYSTHTVGLYIIISVPSKGITVIWDKHTRITIELSAFWRNKVCGLCGNFDSNEMNDLQISGSAVMSSPMAFGNSWKAATPPCSDVTSEIFPCERNTYCSAWAEQRCMILTGDIFKDCHLKVDPDPYYQACVQESCSCEFEGKFLGFCTAVAAYAEACSDQHVCINWRTPDLCPVYCDYYNKQGQCSWHYEACGKMLTCGKGNLTHKLEGCYPRCPKDAPYYDENTSECTKLRECTCYVDETVIRPGAVVLIQSIGCRCENGKINCQLNSSSTPTAPPPTIVPPTTPTSPTSTSFTSISTPTETIYSPSTTPTTTASTTETWSPMTTTTSTTTTSGRCDIYGDPHYITFQGTTFDFMNDCTYILVEEQSPRHHLMIAVDNFECAPARDASCVKGIILKYQNSIATLTINLHLFTVQATLNNRTIEPPYEEHGWRFEVTGYIVSIYLPEIRSYVSLSPSYNLVINLAMEHFHNNTQGQCGVCGTGSCIRKGGQIEDDSCCEKTAYDWVYADPLKPACFSAPRDVPCHPGTTVAPTSIPTTTTSCPASRLCELLQHPVFATCSRHLNLMVKKKNCEFDSCRTGACSSLEQAAEECKKVGFCIDWRTLTNGSCDWTCPEGLVYRECHNKLDDFCYGGVQYPGASLENNSAGCFCPSSLMRAGSHSNICVPECPYCKGPLGEPRLPGEVWQSGCYLCTCNNQTRTEDCFPKPLEPTPTCGPNAELVNTSCCGDLACGNQSCAPKVANFNITIDNCSTIMQMPVCQGQCISQPRVVFKGDLQVEQKCQCCQEQSSERRSVTLQCFDHARLYNYKHITRLNL